MQPCAECGALSEITAEDCSECGAVMPAAPPSSDAALRMLSELMRERAEMRSLLDEARWIVSECCDCEAVNVDQWMSSTERILERGD